VRFHANTCDRSILKKGAQGQPYSEKAAERGLAARQWSSRDREAGFEGGEAAALLPFEKLAMNTGRVFDFLLGGKKERQSAVDRSHASGTLLENERDTW